MPKTPKLLHEDEVLLRMLATPPTPHADMKAKKKPSPATGKAKSAKGKA